MTVSDAFFSSSSLSGSTLSGPNADSLSLSYASPGIGRMETHDVQWYSYSVRRALPLSATFSVALHVSFLILLITGVFAWFTRATSDSIEFEPVVMVGQAGGGGSGADENSGVGVRTGVVDALQSVESHRVPTPKVSEEPSIEPKTIPDEPSAAVIPETDLVASRIKNLAPVPNFSELIRGLPNGNANEPGRATGQGEGRGRGDGLGEGDGNGPGGRLTTKQRRQLRWHLVFDISNAADYLDQLYRMKAIVGFQYPDQSVRLVADLKKRPAVLQPATRIPDRIFWMDDDRESIRTICEELRVSPMPRRVIAFFPESLEEELLRKERAYGQRYGRHEEDDFVETTFHVTHHYGQINIRVIRQIGR
jgi:hypothetical protein